MKKLLLLFVTLTCALLCGLIVEVSRHEAVPMPPAPAVGRFQLRTDVFVDEPVVFDTATGRFYGCTTNGVLVVDPVSLARPSLQHYRPASKDVSSFTPPPLNSKELLKPQQ